jgi:hypothetical protein
MVGWKSNRTNFKNIVGTIVFYSSMKYPGCRILKQMYNLDKSHGQKTANYCV